MVKGYSKAVKMLTQYKTSGRPQWVHDQKIMWIIIHGTASGTNYPATSTARDFQTSGRASTHYIVGYDGTVVQCVDEDDTAWGNGPISGLSGKSVQGGGKSSTQHDSWWNTVARNDCNACTISIEHSKSIDNTSELSPAQKTASFSLIADIVTRWHDYIPVQLGTSKGGITGHYSMDPINRQFCPGNYPWNELITFLSGQKAVNAPKLPTPGTPTTPTPTPGTPTTPGTIGTKGTLEKYTSVLNQVHATLVANTGFYAMELAIDEIEQLPGWIDLTDTWNAGPFSFPDPVGIVRSVGATLTDNFLPVLIRGAISGIGLILLLLLLYKAVIDSGIGDVVKPLATLAVV